MLFLLGWVVCVPGSIFIKRAWETGFLIPRGLQDQEGICLYIKGCIAGLGIKTVLNQKNELFFYRKKVAFYCKG